MPDRPAITDFRPGVPYGVPFVAAFLGRTTQTVRDLIRAKRLAAFRPKGSKAWMVPGEAVIAYVGENRLHAARADAAADLPPPEARRRAVDRIQREAHKRRAKAAKESTK